MLKIDVNSLGLRDSEKKRFKETFAAMPEDAKTVLEIGFHDFRLTDVLRDHYELVSIDIPHPVADPGERRLVFSSIEALPFEDDAFDMVVCTEVLEHLDDDIFDKGVAELQRISKKYILVTVPYRQRVWNELFKCAECGFIRNSWDHVRHVDDDILRGAFFDSELIDTRYIAEINGYAPDWLYKAANRVGNWWQHMTFGNCANCRQTDQPPKPNLMGEILIRVIWRWERRVPSRPAWVLTLFRPH